MTKQLFRCRRRMKLGGSVYGPGDVVDLIDFDLPVGRVQQLVQQRMGEIVTEADKLATGEKLPESPAPSPGPVDVELPDLEKPNPYLGWTKLRLQEEAERLGVSGTGTIAEITDRLLGALEGVEEYGGQHGKRKEVPAAIPEIWNKPVQPNNHRRCFVYERCSSYGNQPLREHIPR